MTAVTHPIVSTRRVIGVWVAAAVIAVSLGLALTLAFVTTNSSAHTGHLGRADTALCNSFTIATPSSPAAFRLADQISTQGSCQ